MEFSKFYFFSFLSCFITGTSFVSKLRAASLAVRYEPLVCRVIRRGMFLIVSKFDEFLQKKNMENGNRFWGGIFQQLDMGFSFFSVFTKIKITRKLVEKSKSFVLIRFFPV